MLKRNVIPRDVKASRRFKGRIEVFFSASAIDISLFSGIFKV